MKITSNPLFNTILFNFLRENINTNRLINQNYELIATEKKMILSLIYQTKRLNRIYVELTNLTKYSHFYRYYRFLYYMSFILVNIFLQIVLINSIKNNNYNINNL